LKAGKISKPIFRKTQIWCPDASLAMSTKVPGVIDSSHGCWIRYLRILSSGFLLWEYVLFRFEPCYNFTEIANINDINVLKLPCTGFEKELVILSSREYLQLVGYDGDQQ
jgi:hypothetical protein